MTSRWLALALLVLTAPAVARVTVSFINPEKYTDATLENSELESARLSLQKGLRQHFQALADRYLPRHRSLAIDVLDIDLAGRLEPWGHQADMERFFTHKTWPSMKLRYVLKDAGGKVVSSGEEGLSDQYYLDLPNPYSPRDPLRYEKPMLEKWFREKFEGG